MIYLVLLLNIVFGMGKNEKSKTDESDLVKVEILSDYHTHNQNEINLLFKLNIKDKWHTYWRNPGDSGLPTDIQIETKDKVSVSDVIFCGIPEKLPFDDLANYGFSNNQFLLVKIKPNENKEIILNAKISWLVCKEECIPQDTTISLKIPFVKKTEINQINDKLIQKIVSELPKSQNLKNQKAKQIQDEVILCFDEILSPKIQFFAYEGGIFVHGSEQKVILDKSSTQLYLQLDEFRTEDPKKLKGILIYDNKAIEISVPILK
jgi:thiol:disulfide interchange protein DsbD